MSAITQHRYGSSDVLNFEAVELPVIDESEVLIEVRAAAIDRGTEHLMTGMPMVARLAFGMSRPKTPILGLDAAGVVVAVGSAVTRFQVGDEVFGIVKGSLAEYAAAKEHKLSHKPTNLDFEQAAASAVSGITALQALTEAGRLQPGQRVLVIGASGGVGSFAVQLAKALGATVDGVAGPQKLELIRTLGASQVFDHTTTTIDDIADQPQKYDLVIDAGGANRVKAIRRTLTRSGTLVIVGAEDGNRLTGGVGRQIRAAALSPFVSHRLVMFLSREHHSSMDELATHLASGAVIPAIGDRYPLAETARAMRQLSARQQQGKIVITVA